MAPRDLDCLDTDDIMLIGPSEQEETKHFEVFGTHSFQKVEEKNIDEELEGRGGAMAKQ